MFIITKLSKCLRGVSPRFNYWRDSRHWEKQFAVSSTTPYILTHSQEEEIRKVFPYQKIKDFRFHNFYTHKTGRFSPLYIPDSLYYSHIVTYLNNSSKAEHIDDKNLYERLIDTDGLKLPKTLVHRMTGYLLNDKYSIIHNWEDVIENIKKYDEVFVKISLDSCGGKGVEVLTTDKPASEIIRSLEGFGTDFVVQAPVRQHSMLASLNPSSVNTVRMVSFLTREGRVKILSTIVRMGRSGSRVDNASSGGITCGVNEEGGLKSVAYTSKGERFLEHPDTGVHFENVSIPRFQELKRIIARLQEGFPYFRLISWDIAIDQDGEFVLIEPNYTRGQLDFHQLNNGPLFGDMTRDILEECASHSHPVLAQGVRLY